MDKRGARGGPQRGDVLAVHERQAAAGRGVEQADHGGVRIKAQGHVPGENADELDHDRAAGAAPRHRQHGAVLGGHGLARRRLDGARGERLEALGHGVQQRHRIQNRLDVGARQDEHGGQATFSFSGRVDERGVETPSFSFRLEPVRTLRQRAEEREREALSADLRIRAEGEALLRQATDAVSAARAAGHDTVTAGRVSAVKLLTAQAYLERTERLRVEAARELARREAGFAIRRETLAAAARDRQSIDKLKDRRKAEHEAEWARRSQNTLDELALAVHRRGSKVAA